MATKVFRGTIVGYSGKTGYGFIRPDRPEEVPGLRPGKDVFFRSARVDVTLVNPTGWRLVGFPVAFIVSNEDPRGPEAVKIDAPPEEGVDLQDTWLALESGTAR